MVDNLLFNGSPKNSIGVEVELQIVDSKTLASSSGANLILNDLHYDLHIKQELLDSIIEINTGVCENIDQVKHDLIVKINRVHQIARKYNLSLISLGSHPYSKWEDQQVTNNERYQQLLGQIQWPLRRMLTTGVHVHIGIDSGEKAIAICNALKQFIPVMIAISANSPFFGGENTGLASTRSKIFESLPNSGIPPSFNNYGEFQNFIKTFYNSRTIESVRDIWWDIRPHPIYGTIEIRVFDSVPKIDEIVSLAAFSLCLVKYIQINYEKGDNVSPIHPSILMDNKWRSIRYGIDADIVIDNNGNLCSIKKFIYNIFHEISPISKTLGCQKNLSNILNSIEENNLPYQRLLKDYSSSQDLNLLVKKSIHELESGIILDAN